MAEIKLSKIPTVAPKGIDKEATKAKTLELVEEIKELQNVLMASSKRSLLVILQGMDANGKDGATKNVFGGINPAGISVHSFKNQVTKNLRTTFYGVFIK